MRFASNAALHLLPALELTSSSHTAHRRTNTLAAKYAPLGVSFVTLYTVEVHPADSVVPYSGRVRTGPCSTVNQALNYDDRLANARKIQTDLCSSTTEPIDLDNVHLVIDDLTPSNSTAGNNPAWCQIGQGANMAFIFSGNNTVVYQNE